MKLYQEADAEPRVLQGKRIAVLGYGIQGRAQALNLRDQGLDVVVGLRPDSASRALAASDGVPTMVLSQAVKGADVVMLLVPDEEQPRVYAQDVEPFLRPGSTLVFAHGFNLHYGTIRPGPGVNVLLLAPKAPGAAVRTLYTQGTGAPALLAVHQDRDGHAFELGLALAWGIGATRAGVIETTVAEETETDLFGEQAVLCGGLAGLVQRGFDVLVHAGYSPAVAYFEVQHELKLIVDLVQAGGLEHMWENVSNTAEYGGRTRGPVIVDENVEERMRAALSDIRSGVFAREWLQEFASGLPRLRTLRAKASEHPLEVVGPSLRSMFAPRTGSEPKAGVRPQVART